MFDTLSSKLESVFKKIRSRGKVTEADLDASLEEIKTALLEADVNYTVVTNFCANIRKKSLGAQVIKSLSPGQMIIKHVHEELIEALGKHEPLNLRFAPPVVIMVVGLQGSGKTTSCGKLARYLRDDLKRRPLLVPADVYRPAAIEQLKTLGASLQIPVYQSTTADDPVKIAERALTEAKNSGLDTVILDTAGRLQIDKELMNELAEIVEKVQPHEILLVVDSMTGQEAANVAKGFNDRLDIDGVILTKLDGDARGGAALSMRSVINKPIKFIGLGEKLDALDQFYPDRLASRILGMGDIMTLIEKAQKQVSLEDAKNIQKKLKKDEFSLEDFLSQLKMIKGMGSFSSLMGMIPGMAQATKAIDDETAEKEFKHVEAMILSMTPAERHDVEIIDGSRRKRIAVGSGNSVEKVNAFLKQFSEMRKMMKKFMKFSGGAGGKGLGGMGDLLKGSMFKGGMKPPMFPR